MTSPEQQQHQHPHQKGRGLQQGIHQSVFSPAPSLHPYHDLPLGWAENSGKLAKGIEGLSADDVGQWSVERVVEFVTSLPGCDAIGPIFEEQVWDTFVKASKQGCRRYLHEFLML